MSNSVADHGRVLSLLEANGLIKLEEGIDKTTATERHCEIQRPSIRCRYEAALLPQLYENGEGDAVLINSNYAIDAGLNPLRGFNCK